MSSSSRSPLLILALLVTLALIHPSSSVKVLKVPESTQDQALYPDWAHDHWVWLYNGVSNQTNVLEMVSGYLAHNITVGAVDIDSEWSTGINNFVVDTAKFPDLKGLIDHLHTMDIRVIMWATSLVDTDSPNYDVGLKNNFFVSEGWTVKWWKGHGSFIDYSNPDALEWWHSQMDNVISLGIDGWKCDGTDPYLFELIAPYGYEGFFSERTYANWYYRDFFEYTRKFNSDSLIMSRPVDSFKNLVYWDFSPRDVVFAGWVGDEDCTFSGLRDALSNMIESAWANYVNFGSDIGGYRTPVKRTQELFLRWAQLGAFVPLMENGGGGIHEPWLFPNPEETVSIYRKFVDQHQELKPYFLSAGTTAYNTGVSVIRPLATSLIGNPGHSWDFNLWNDIFVAPMVESGTQRVVKFPSGNTWIHWFDGVEYEGGTTVNMTVPLSTFPAFKRKGAIIPLHVDNDRSLHGDSSSKGCLTLLIHPVALACGSGGESESESEQVVVRRWKDISTEVSYTSSCKKNGAPTMAINATPSPQCLIFRLRGVKEPLAISNLLIVQDGEQESMDAIILERRESLRGRVSYDAEREELVVRPGEISGGVKLEVDF